MFIDPPKRTVIPVTVTLDPIDIDLLDRVAALSGRTRSAEVRDMLRQLRPMLRALVESLEAAARTRDEFDKTVAIAVRHDLEDVVPEVERIQGVVLGALARLEGAAAVRMAEEGGALGDWLDPRPSSNGGHITPTRGNELPETGE